MENRQVYYQTSISSPQKARKHINNRQDRKKFLHIILSLFCLLLSLFGIRLSSKMCMKVSLKQSNEEREKINKQAGWGGITLQKRRICKNRILKLRVGDWGEQQAKQSIALFDNQKQLDRNYMIAIRKKLSQIVNLIVKELCGEQKNILVLTNCLSSPGQIGINSIKYRIKITFCVFFLNQSIKFCNNFKHLNY